jgi:hypothetical protein
MSDLYGLGVSTHLAGYADDRPLIRQSVARMRLNRVLEFTGYSIHDILNNPIARNGVQGYYKIYCWVERECKARDTLRWRKSERE